MATQAIEMKIGGMDCPDCARTLERGVAQLGGVEDCEVSFGSGRLRTSYDPERTSRAAIEARVRALGYEPAPQSGRGSSAAPASGAARSWRLLPALGGAELALAAGGALLLASLAGGLLGAPAALVDGAALLALAVAGAPVAAAALRALLLSRRVTITLLMVIAAIGAVLIGETQEAAAVVVLFALGEALESFSMARARRALGDLEELAPASATVLEPHDACADGDGCCASGGPRERVVPVAEVPLGATIRVLPGERVPLDGTVTAGQSFVSQQHITGESMPVARGAGDSVYAGSLNSDGALELRVSSSADGTLLSRIGALVKEAQSQRAPIERTIDRFAARYTPAVVALAAVVALVPPLFGQPFFDTPEGHGWLYRALALLVIACPCALVISTPVSVVSALAAAYRAGALVKGGAALEALRGVRAVAFDKTGTLTRGQPRVLSVRCADAECAQEGCAEGGEALALAAAVEAQSAHPLAGAVLRAADERAPGARPSASAVTALPGRGVRGTVGARSVTVGSHALFDAAHAHSDALCAQLRAAEGQGQTVLLVGDDESGDTLGYFTVADTLRPEARAAVAGLRAAGVAHTALLTGDTHVAGALVARAAGVDEARGGMLPADKLDAVRDLARRYGGVALVGDGSNDAPALAAATVGVAMGAAGSAQALAAAEVALLDDDLRKLPWLLRLSQRAGAIIGQNIAISLAAKLVALLLALAGIAPLWLAVLADSGVALLVIANGMRLLRERPPEVGIHPAP
jgi:Cd2+/Zn2+-exporting ATPase